MIGKMVAYYGRIRQIFSTKLNQRLSCTIMLHVKILFGDEFGFRCKGNSQLFEVCRRFVFPVGKRRAN